VSGAGQDAASSGVGTGASASGVWVAGGWASGVGVVTAVAGAGMVGGSMVVRPPSATASVQVCPAQYRYWCLPVGSVYHPGVTMVGVVIADLL
jgi:hypothetical protein